VARVAEPIPFSVLFKKTSVVIGNLTAAIVFFRELVVYLDEGKRIGFRAAAPDFAVAFLLKATLLSLANCLVVALPLAGVIYYFRYLARER